MKTFDIYTRNDGTCKAVKKGWSWPAFFFGSIWAICMQMWLIGILLLPVEIILQLLISASDEIKINSSVGDTETTNMIGDVIAVIGLGIRIIFGSFGNSWKHKKLERSGYKHERTIQARSKGDAISSAANDSIQSIPTSGRV